MPQIKRKKKVEYFNYKEFYNSYKDSQPRSQNNGLEEFKIGFNHSINLHLKPSINYDQRQVAQNTSAIREISR